MNKEMILSTQDFLGDYEITKTIGLVRGNTVRSRNIGRNFLAKLKTIVGGEISAWTIATSDAREQALQRLVAHATELDADAIVGLRFISAEVDATASEILAYGTAVKIKAKV